MHTHTYIHYIYIYIFHLLHAPRAAAEVRHKPFVFGLLVLIHHAFRFFPSEPSSCGGASQTVCIPYVRMLTYADRAAAEVHHRPYAYEAFESIRT
jgi:hypothetical protein